MNYRIKRFFNIFHTTSSSFFPCRPSLPNPGPDRRIRNEQAVDATKRGKIRAARQYFVTWLITQSFSPRRGKRFRCSRHQPSRRSAQGGDSDRHSKQRLLFLPKLPNRSEKFSHRSCVPVVSDSSSAQSEGVDGHAPSPVTASVLWMTRCSA